MKNVISKWACLFLALFLIVPATLSAAEDPNLFDLDNSYYNYRGGEGPLPLPEAYFLRIPKQVREYNRLGIQSFLENDFKTALAYFRAARALDPERPELLFNEALTLAEMNRHAEAAVVFHEAKNAAKVTGNGLILHSPTLQTHIGKAS